MVQAQLIWTEPAFPKADDEVTVYFNATEGTGGLANCNCDVYVHTGVITSLSSSSSDWKHVVTDWGVANPAWKMDPVAGQPNVYSYTLSPSVKQYYGVTGSEVIEELAIVFRNANGSKEGKADGGADIFYPIYPDDGEFLAVFFAPLDFAIGQIGQNISIVAGASDNAELSLYDNGDLLISIPDTKSLNYDLEVMTAGTHLVELVANNGIEVVRDTFFYTANPAINNQDPPAGTRNGINYLNDSTVLLQLYAPDKQFVYVIGDFNDWVPTENFYMNRSLDEKTWWLEVSGLTPNQRYGFQYWVDGDIRIADPHSELILDKWNDGAISPTTYPNPHPYPGNSTSGHVTLIHPGKPAYQWQVTDFQAPAKKDLVIYELLPRDFVHAHNYLTIIDSLDYLENLGINAIELMPPGEFENNESWGYNPSYHMALDKYYGTPEHFKMFVDECHKRGIAVIVDIVFNHAFGQSPLVNLYWDAANNRPAANNPWMNAICPHEPFCWGYDFNHTREATQEFMDIVNTFWLEEYNVDGFRLDFTKGFSMVGNVGWDPTRIDLLKRMADVIWDANPDAYIILEHWADNNEEKILSNYGMMLWGNATHAYQEAAMGYIGNSDFSWGIYKQRGWADPHLVTYVESHDEERIMFKNLQWGNSQGNYNVKDLSTALKRMELVSTFLFTIPGPKMIWQFGEVGYDISIDDPCRVCNKPILWNYFQETDRRHLYDVVSALAHLKTENEVFGTDDFTYDLDNFIKRIKLNHPSMNALVIGNFGTTPGNPQPVFQHTGWWYEYFSGDSINVVNVTDPIFLNPGEYRIYTTEKLMTPDIISSVEDNIERQPFNAGIYPNPSSGNAILSYLLPENADIQINLYHASGQHIETLFKGNQTKGLQEFELNDDYSNGTYFLQISSGNNVVVKKWIVL